MDDSAGNPTRIIFGSRRNESGASGLVNPRRLAPQDLSQSSLDNARKPFAFSQSHPRSNSLTFKVEDDYAMHAVSGPAHSFGQTADAFRTFGPTFKKQQEESFETPAAHPTAHITASAAYNSGYQASNPTSLRNTIPSRHHKTSLPLSPASVESLPSVPSSYFSTAIKPGDRLSRGRNSQHAAPVNADLYARSRHDQAVEDPLSFSQMAPGPRSTSIKPGLHIGSRRDRSVEDPFLSRASSTDEALEMEEDDENYGLMKFMKDQKKAKRIIEEQVWFRDFTNACLRSCILAAGN